jgi:hypothetical protein
MRMANEYKDGFEEHEIDVKALQKAVLRDAGDGPTSATSIAMLVRMGRNLLQFNNIECVLKKTLPYMHPRGARAGADAFEDFRNEIEKETLGKVAKLLVQSMESEDIEVIRSQVKNMVDARNELVHHFAERFKTGTEAGSREAILWLDEQYEFCKPFADMCLTFLTVTLYGMEKNAAANGDDLLIPAWHKNSDRSLGP